jgi:PHD/YefM family antitoxin component YafN of YafNO toxin-antitoxin module
MSDQPFQSLDVSHLRSALNKIHEQVAGNHGRVELTRAGCDDVCVILSKAELESLERALEIFSETAEYKAMCDNLSRLAVACGAVGPAGNLLHSD